MMMTENRNMLHLSQQEYEELFADIMKKLKEPFPENTVQKKNSSGKSAHIPVQAYIKKLNEAAGGYYTWRISSEKPIIHAEEGFLEMRGVLSILDRSCEGQGFQHFTYVNGTKRIHNIDETIKAAVRRALVNALDYFEAGWVDLSPYRDWGKIPFLSSHEEGEDELGSTSNNPRCANCDEVLTDKELAAIVAIPWKIYYCDKHVPDFVRKKMQGGK
ncbi:hypothetical protein [Paenibacillus sp. Y412MC10]|uniref:hypothetical protein n=1 Tax=Geobacillus sp. (strain Y412MC10) TaxID=481743 RepID=UPI0011AB5CA2|nr:hypothetical protein [Paenibacillus sp. Y412MC10]